MAALRASWVARGLMGAATFVVGMAASTGLAQATSHYSPGVEGIKGASLPPPGVYFRDYNQFYTSDRLNDNKGDKIDAVDFNTFAYAQIPRLIWITDAQVLGGNIGVDGLWPIVYQDVSVDPLFSDNAWSFGDPFAEGTWSSHLKQFDLSAGVGEWFPAGTFSTAHPADAGLGYWTTMFTAGVTWYIDPDKTWAISALNRYEINTPGEADVTSGQAYTLEWGLSKSVIKTVDIGLVGYYQRQTTTDSGTAAPNNLDGVLAIGPEVVVAFPDQSLFISLRYNYEFWSVNRAQGNNIVLTATYRF